MAYFVYVNGPIPVPFPYGPGGALGDNLTGLPDGYAMGLGALGAAGLQYYDDNMASLMITSGSGVSPTGTASLYVVVSEDGVRWTNGVNPSVNEDQSLQIMTGVNPVPALQTIDVTVDGSTYYFRLFSIASVLLYMPTFWAIVIGNDSGAAFSANPSGFYAAHSLIGYP
jgi:hypothetical protein